MGEAFPEALVQRWYEDDMHLMMHHLFEVWENPFQHAYYTHYTPSGSWGWERGINIFEEATPQGNEPFTYTRYISFSPHKLGDDDVWNCFLDPLYEHLVEANMRAGVNGRIPLYRVYEILAAIPHHPLVMELSIDSQSVDDFRAADWENPDWGNPEEGNPDWGDLDWGDPEVVNP
jgi:hypothetical protein